MKQIMLPVIIGLLVLSWITVVQGISNDKTTYQESVELAKEYETKGFYIEAIQCYETALSINPNMVEYKKAIAMDYYALAAYSDFEAMAEQVIRETGGDVDMSAALVEYYIHEQQLIDAFKKIDQGLESAPDNERLQALFDSIKGQYKSSYASYGAITEFDNGCAKITLDGKDGVIDDTGDDVIALGPYTKIFEIGTVSDYSAVAANNGEGCFYFDTDGYKRLSPDEKYDYLGTFCDEYAVVSRNGKWGYINHNFEEQGLLYDAVTVFCDGIAAVQKNGKWAIINSDLQENTGYEYEDVVVDEYNRCSINGTIFVVKDGKYYLINEKGEVLSQGFDNAKPFINKDGCAAVCSGEQWGLINKKGEIVLEPKFQELGSGSEGLAAFMEDGKWGYITEKGEIFIEAVFDGAKGFNAAGYAAVKQEDVWGLIQLYLYDK